MTRTRRPSERYTREDFYRNDNPDHHPSELEDNRWHFAGKFEDRNDPTYSYGTRDRDMMPEYPTYPTNKEEFYQLHPDERNRQQRGYDQGFSRSQYGNERSYSQSYSEPTYAGRGPKGWKRSDESIKEQVCHALEQHPRIDATEVEVDVKEGVVTLRGNIHDRSAKRLAGDVIDWLPGVTDVHNNLTIDQTFFERAKALFTDGNADSIDSGAAETPSKAGRPEKNPRH